MKYNFNINLIQNVGSSIWTHICINWFIKNANQELELKQNLMEDDDENYEKTKFE